MDAGQVEIKMQPESAARVIYGNASKFTRIPESHEFRFERPLMVNAWSQTTLEDFGMIDNFHRQENFELQREIETLRERVQSLEGDLRVHVELLNQIHATAALKPGMQRISTEHLTSSSPSSPFLQQQQPQQQHYPHPLPQPPPLQRSRHISSAIPNGAVYTPQNQVGGPQVINSAHVQVEHAHMPPATDSFKYTIIGNNYEPIEIQLAEEDGAINLNNSADSGRLEICLSADEQNMSNKENTPRNKVRKPKKERKSTTPPLPPQSGILVKRRKSNTNGVESSAALSEVQYNDYNNLQIPPSHPQNYHHQTADDMSMATKNGAMRQNVKRRSPTIKTTNKSMKDEGSPNVLRNHNDDNVMVSIGPNNTRVPYSLYDTMSWDSASIATRKLLMAIFDRETLATHSMTGKPSPAFKGQFKPQKNRLDPSVIEDIIFVVTRRCKVSEKEVRNAVTTKCADENKMMKLSLLKQNAMLAQQNKENHINPPTNHDENQDPDTTA